MSVSLLDIYNKVTAQSWSIYETGVGENDELEQSVIIAIQKALRTIWNAHSYCFRLKNTVISTCENEVFYPRPCGNIVKNGVRLLKDNEILKPIHYSKLGVPALGRPEYFFIKYNKLGFSPIPDGEYLVSIDYNTFKLGKNSQNQSVYNLENLNDTLDVPQMFEDLFLHALTNKAMLNALASGKSELYEPYLSQFLSSYKNLVLNTEGIEFEKEIKW